MAARKNSIEATIEGIAQPSGWDLLAAYSNFPYRGPAAVERLPLPDAGRILDAVRALFARADEAARKQFALLALSAPMPDFLPFALNGTRLDVPLPSAVELKDHLVTSQPWLEVEDEEDAEALMGDLADTLALAANGVEAHYGDGGLAAEYLGAAETLPSIEDAIAAQVPAEANAVHAAASRVAHVLSQGETDTVTRGLARAVAAWTGEQRYSFQPEEVRELRKAAGLTQEALAERLGMSARHVVRLEKGETRVSPELGRRIHEECRSAAFERTGQPV